MKIHTLICHRDVTTGIVCLQSLYRYNQDAFELVVHDDGTLTADDISALGTAFPRSRVITRLEADDRMESVLQQHPACRALRKEYPLSLKLLDVMLMSDEDLAYCDSDLLFFRPFRRLFQWPDSATGAIFMQDRQFAFAARPWHLAPIGPLQLPANVNTGLIFFRKASYDLDYLEWLWSHSSLRSIFHHISCWAEQTCWAALGFRAGCKLWDPSQLCLASHDWMPDEKTIAAHFVSSYRQRINEFQPGDLADSPATDVAIVSSIPTTAWKAGISQASRRIQRFF